MTTLQDRLHRLGHLKALMDKISPSDREILAREKKFHSGPSFNNMAAMKLRWLNYQIRMLQTEQSSLSENQAYTALALDCERCLGGYPSAQKDNIKKFGESYLKRAQAQLPSNARLEDVQRKAKCLYFEDQIKEQHEELFSHSLTVATQEYFTDYDPKSPFSPQAVIERAMLVYKEQIYGESLKELEISTLIECYGRFDASRTTFGSEKKAVLEILGLHEKLVHDEHVLIATGVHPDLTKFRTRPFKNFNENLDYHRDFKEQMKHFIQANRDYNSNDELTHIFGLHPKEDWNFMVHMASSFEHQERFAKLTIPQMSLEAPLETSNKSILRLREIVQDYETYLKKLITEEQGIYGNRDLEAVKKRKGALEKMKLFADQSEAFTPAVKEMMHNTYQEILKNEPSWFERDFLNKIWDIITAGPVCRFFNNTFSKPDQAVSNMVNTVKGELTGEEDKGPDF
ncbi:Uncharacterised protein [Legionella wadsworthii]|uniref:Uncharacterized protein n=2 Tax=Legionella wadsworthii TaxID=28088 RepID=A0A378LPJ4_9GAMM|nr:Uncharacterised protein [Legionella wadsworthii]